MLGGGQLGRFFVMSAQKLGYKVLVLDPDPNSPAGQIADNHLCASYDDEQALRQIIDSCDYVSTEFENIPAQTLQFLEKNLTVRPSSKAVSIVQMPKGIPVGTFAIGEAGASNAGLFAASILALHDASIQKKLDEFRQQQESNVLQMKLEK